MRTLLAKVSYLTCNLLLAVMGFIATTYGGSIAPSRQSAVLGRAEMAVTCGAQCTQRGGADCAEANPPCQQTGCPGGSTCALIPGSNPPRCNMLGSGGNAVNNCSKNQKGGNCCATCSSGCSNYQAGWAVLIPMQGYTCFPNGSNPLTGVCTANYSCGTPTCGVYNCD